MHSIIDKEACSDSAGGPSGFILELNKNGVGIWYNIGRGKRVCSILFWWMMSGKREKVSHI